MKKPRKAKPATPEQMSAYFAQMGRKGGKARLKTMTPAERSRSAKLAVQAREAKKRSKK